MTHGHRGNTGTSRTPTYNSWRAMRQRCLDPKWYGYHWYGGRGITICKRWDSFANFLADMGERPAGMTLDRINPNGNYTPKNCRWATASTQAKNKVLTLRHAAERDRAMWEAGRAFERTFGVAA